MAVGLSAAEVQGYLEEVTNHFGEVGIAVGCINSPKNVTITGRGDQIDMLKDLMNENNIFARKLLVNVAYHSRYLESIAAEYLDLMGELSSQHLTETPTMISSVTADIITVEELCQGHYWVQIYYPGKILRSPCTRLCTTCPSATERPSMRAHGRKLMT